MVGLRYALSKDGKHSTGCGGALKILKWLVENLGLGVCNQTTLCEVSKHVAVYNYKFNAGGYYSRFFGYGGGPRHRKYFQCTGSEQRLSQCKNFNDTEESRSAGSDVGVNCDYGMCL